MDISKAFVSALLVLLGLLGAHGLRNERSAGGASSGAGAYSGSMAGSSYNDNLHRKVNSHFQSVQAQNKAIQDQIQRQIYDQQQMNGVNSGFGGYGDFGGFGGFGGFGDDMGFGMGGFPSGGSSVPGGFGDHGPASAISSVNIGPQGGYQAGEISPVAPGIASRFGEDVDAPSGGNVAVFSSSSSSQSVGPDGKVISHKSSTTGVNDNGKVSIKTVHDP